MDERIFLRKILNTKDFFFIFANNLDEQFGQNDWAECELDERSKLTHVYSIQCGTNGWDKAFKKTCESFGLMDYYNCYAELDWDESDMVDMTIAELLCAIVFDENCNRVKC